MNALDRLIPVPDLVERGHIDIVAPVTRAWECARHLDLAASPFPRVLLTRRTLPNRLAGERVERRVRLDDFASSPEKPGFQILVDDPPREVVVGGIGKVWCLRIPFVHMTDADAFARFAEPGFIKVAWAIRVSPLGEHNARVEVELRVQGTDDAAWRKFQHYFRLIGPGSHLIRRTALAQIARELSSPAPCGDPLRLAPGEPHVDHVGHGGGSC